MRQFEYRFFNTSPNTVMRVLETIGKEGWEVVMIDFTTNPNIPCVYAKRELPTP